MADQMNETLIMPGSGAAAAATQKRYTFPLILLFIYICVEYGSLQSLTAVRPALLVQVFLLLSLMRSMSQVRIIFRDGYFKLYLMLLMLMTVHVFIARNNFWAFQQWLLMVSYLIFSVSFCCFLDSVEKIRKLLITFIGVLSVYAVDRILTGGALAAGGGIIGESNDCALAMTVGIPVAYYMGLSHRGIRRTGFLIVTVLFVAANVATVSRGGFLGMAAVAVLIWLKSKSKIRSLILLLIVGIIFVSAIPATYKAELMSIRDEGDAVFSGGVTSGDNPIAAKNGTGRDRVELWKVGWRMFLHNPIIGVGPANLPLRLGEYQYDENGNSFWHRDISGRAVHSIYFTLLPELGTVGLLIWVLMLRSNFRKYRYVTRSFPEHGETSTSDDESQMLGNITRGLFFGMIGFIVSGTFLSAFYYPEFWNLSALITAAFFLRKKYSHETTSFVKEG
jgi:O-antigen ligase